MASVHEHLTEQFRKWEIRGRGWQVFEQPVYPEPPFTPFHGHYLPDAELEDDGHRPTFLSSLIQNIGRKLNSGDPPPVNELEAEPEPKTLSRETIVELQLSLPADEDYSKELFEQFLLNLQLCNEPIAFEILGVSTRITIQLVASAEDSLRLREQMAAYFPNVVLRSKTDFLQGAWDASEAGDVSVVDFGLAHEFMLPLATSKVDPFIGIVGTLSQLRASEIALFQILFEPARDAWADNILRSVSHDDGKPYFVNAPELTKAAENKITKPLYATVVRMAIRGENDARTMRIACGLASSLSLFANSRGNHLIPLNNDGYDFEDHICDVLYRQTRRSGMLLSTDELIGFVHLPSSSVRSPALMRDSGKTKAAPDSVTQENGLYLGDNVHLDQSIPVRLTVEQRLRHFHIIGVSGTGKSSLLFNLIRQDIENGEGVGVLDPHGDLIERILGIIPSERIDDVILVDPSDPEYSVGFNIISAHSDLEKNLLASDLVSIFQRLSTSWGDQLGSVLQNAILAFLESSEMGTLSDLRRFLIEPAFRERFLGTVQDSDIVYYWRKAFPQLGGNKSIGPVITRLNTLLSPKPVRHLISQSENRLDFTNILDSGKIFLAKLPEGQIGKENSYLIGSLLVAKFQQLVMGRQVQKIESRRPFWLYIDEFQSFITPSMAQILSGARKYGFGLILAHQELHHLERNQDVKNAVLSNAHTRVVFRVGDSDARALENGFAAFAAKDLQNLENFHALCRVGKANGDFNLAIPSPVDPPVDQAEQNRIAIIAASRAKYATRRTDVEASIIAKLNVAEAEKPKPKNPPVVKNLGNNRFFEKSKDRPGSENRTPITTTAINPLPVTQDQDKVMFGSKPASVAAPKALLPRLLGRGGPKHKALQEQLQKAARELDFSADIEKQLRPESNCAADLLVTKGLFSIAVEMRFTTPADHELENIEKCLDAGVSRVAVVATSIERLNEVAREVRKTLNPESAAKVGYFTPVDFIAELKKIAQAIKINAKDAAPEGKLVHGYKVKRTGANLTPEERRAKEEIRIRIIAESMKRKEK